MRKLLLCSLWLLAMSGTASAGETDWLYFPMYERDTAHAVHLSALHFRADGLLDSATRYPRHPDESWTDEQSQLGWYDYSLRLIDCQTGFHVDTSERLLARDGAVVAERNYDVAQWLSQLQEQLRDPVSLRWPDNSEIALACIAAAHPTLKQQRARMAQQSATLVSDRPLVQRLVEETNELFARGLRPVDVEALARQRAKSAVQLFERATAQYDAWRRGLDPGFVPQALDAARLAVLQHSLDAKVTASGGTADIVRVLAPGRVEYSADWQGIYDTPPRQASAARHLATRYRCDCRSGVQVPVSRRWYSDEGRLLLEKPIAIAEVLQQLRRDYPAYPPPEPPNLLRTQETLQGAPPACVLLADAEAAAAREAGVRKAVDLQQFKFEPSPQGATPATLLLALRAAIQGTP